MDKQQLEYFILAADTCNISRAASRLWISQSALSQTIKRLEKELGCLLFTRSGKKIVLNENGRIFYNYARQMKICYDNALHEIQESNDTFNREIRLFVGCASLYLPQLLSYLKRNTRDVTFRIMQMESVFTDAEDADLSIVAASGPMDSPNAALLLEEDILLAMPHDHPLAEVGKIELNDLKNFEFVSLNLNWTLENVIQEKCSQHCFEPNVAIRVDNPAILRNLLCEELGIAFIPEKTWNIRFSNGGLVLKKVEDISLKRYVYLIGKEGCQKQTARTCADLIRRFFEATFA